MKSFTVTSALWWATSLLEEAGIETARLDAECLLAETLGWERGRLLLERGWRLRPFELQAFEGLLERRMRREPIAYILGRKEFWSLPLRVTPAVLIPRPETEVLIEAVLARLRREWPVGSSQWPANSRDLHWSLVTGHRSLVVVEVGTGSGAIALALAQELPSARIYATELSSEALTVARENSGILGLEGRIRFLQGDLFEPLQGLGLEGAVDLVASNPPYILSGELERLQPEISYEPRLALNGGPDGLAVFRRIAAEAHMFLKPGGFLALEIGADQAKAVIALLEGQRRYEAIEVVKDYAGRDRVVLARRRLGNRVLGTGFRVGSCPLEFKDG